MKTSTIPEIKVFLSLSIGFSALIFVIIPSTVSAVGCNFYRDIGVGSSGNDVTCLQEYLNRDYLHDRGYTLGGETGVYSGNTQQAVIWWQQTYGITPATGYFGPASRTKYQSLVSIANGTDRNRDTDNYDRSRNSNSSDRRDAENEIEGAFAEILDALEEMHDRNRNTNRAEKEILAAISDLSDAIESFFDGDYDKATSRAEDARNNAEDAFDEAKGRRSNNDNNRNNEDDAEDLIDDVQDQIDDAWDDINDADDDGDDVNDAEDFLRDAEDRLEDARDELDDGDEDEAIDLAHDAEDLVDDALDELDEHTDNDNQYARNGRFRNIWDELGDAWDAVHDAVRDNNDFGDADLILQQAEDRLWEAEDNLDRGDRNDADDRADEAQDLIRDALEEID